jgi:hypothetical protein
MNKDRIKKMLTLLIVALLATSAMITLTQAAATDCSATLAYTGSGTASHYNDVVWGDVIELTAPGNAVDEVNEGRIVITLPEGTTLGDITSLSWKVYTEEGYPPHADFILGDGDGNPDDSLVFEFAYQPYDGTGYAYDYIPGVPYGHYDPALQGSYYDPPYDTWVETLQNDVAEEDTDEINDESVAWLGSGLAGPYPGGYFGTLGDFKAGTVTVIGGTENAGVDSSTEVLEIHIEVDNWIGPALAYVDDVAINGETLISVQPPTLEIVSPLPQTYSPGNIPVEITAWDIFGVESVTYNVKNAADEWLYTEDQEYTDPTTISILATGDYTLCAWAVNALGLEAEAHTSFTVQVTQVTISVHPQTLNLRSGGRWITVKIHLPEGMDPEDLDITKVRLWVNGDPIESEWSEACDDYVMIKFSRDKLQELGSPDEEVEIKITGELPGGGSFDGTDTIRMINPGNGKVKATQKQNQGKSNNSKGPNNNHGKGPKDKGPKNGKGPKKNG